MIWFFDHLEKYPNLHEPTISNQMEATRANYIQRRGKMASPVNLGKVYVLRAGKF